MIIRSYSPLSQMLDNLGAAAVESDAGSLRVENLALKRALQACEDRLGELTQQKVADDRKYQLLAEELGLVAAERDALQMALDELNHELNKHL